MSLKEYSEKELQQELNDRKQRKQDTPTPVEEPDYSDVFASAVEYITELSETGSEPKDYPQYVFETVMEAVYGKNVWDYINEINDL